MSKESYGNVNNLFGVFIDEWELGCDDTTQPRMSTQGLQDYSTRSQNCKVEAYFENITDLFVSYANHYDVAVGAVAWLTNEAILTAFSRMKRTAFVVQKEDFLRKDVKKESLRRRSRKYRNLYGRMPAFDHSDFRETHPGQQDLHPDYNSAAQKWLFDASGNYQIPPFAVRCAGYARNDDNTSPKMHHKFVVFGWLHNGLIMIPDRVVTGSFNLTENAAKSRENVISVQDKKICHAYLSEWSQLWCLSEELDWHSGEPATNHYDMST